MEETIPINWFAVVAATAVTFALGGLWFGPLFGKAWMKELGVDPENAKSGDMGKIFGYSIAFTFVMAYCLAMFFGFGADVTAITGALYGFLAGFGWVSLSIAVNSQFEGRSWKYVWITGGYWTLAFTLMGLILGLWK